MASIKKLTSQLDRKTKIRTLVLLCLTKKDRIMPTILISRLAEFNLDDFHPKIQDRALPKTKIHHKAKKKTQPTKQKTPPNH